MGHAALVVTSPVRDQSPLRVRDFQFESLFEIEPLGVRRSTAVFTSFAIHTALITAAVLVPILLYNILPEPGEAVRAFFVAPSLIAPPPPPPPPPAAGVRVARAPAVARPQAPDSFVAPMEVPSAVVPDEALDLGGVEGGVPGGVEGGIAGGVVGGVIGGLPLEPPPPRKAVRVGGAIIAPKLVNRVAPEYPPLAALSRVQGIVILEAVVGEDGRVQTVAILRGHLLLQEPAIEAVKQWRYQPLLLNGQPTPFVLTVTLVFKLESPAAP
jgi:protein TonB